LLSFSETNREKALEYIVRAYIGLGKYQKARDLSLDSESSQLFQDFVDFLELGADSENAGIEAVIQSPPHSELSLVLGGIYLAKLGRVEESLALLHLHQNSLECVSLIVQLYLITNRVKKAQQELEISSRWAQDSIVHNLAESWVNLTLGGSLYQSSFYFFEEISQQHTSIETLLGLLVVSLQLHHVEESADIVTQLYEVAQLHGIQLDPSVYANEITIGILKGDTSKQEELREKIKQSNPNHPYLLDYEARVEQFDAIVARYHE